MRMLVFVFQLRNSPSIQYARNWGKEGGHHRSKDAYILNGWSQTNVVEYFLSNGMASAF